MVAWEKIWRILDVLISSCFRSHSSLTICDDFALLFSILSWHIMTNNIQSNYDWLYVYIEIYPYTSIFRYFISIRCLDSQHSQHFFWRKKKTWRFRTMLRLWGWSSYPTGSWGHPHRRKLSRCSKIGCQSLFAHVEHGCWSTLVANSLIFVSDMHLLPSSFHNLRPTSGGFG